MAGEKSTSDLPEPLRTTVSALRRVPGVGLLERAAQGTLDKVEAITPRRRRLAVYTGAGVLGVAGVVEWPVAIAGAAVAWLTQPRPEEEHGPEEGAAQASEPSEPSATTEPAAEVSEAPEAEKTSETTEAEETAKAPRTTETTETIETTEAAGTHAPTPAVLAAQSSAHHPKAAPMASTPSDKLPTLPAETSAPKPSQTPAAKTRAKRAGGTKTKTRAKTAAAETAPTARRGRGKD
ncbi:hypothetical protein [Streptomyces sp. NPDC020996]|uniref:hypothetical protein n=1 Tax=Streptomyces sp. NPDC020996 TaxID=3154791 RepID=UPI00340A2676